ncbi:ABC transporter substrate-binding protein (plasmid) [Arthrobacter sp. ZXY-2]|uniref:ABC transporter substrate-binding protein n=1 Tax=Paenarthrobacter ureafaciens TaxID=37931 RepID=UPI0008A71469|nr:ABC transporter substrate-binding protein [Arthrobacter sp. ZXY-2]
MTTKLFRRARTLLPVTLLAVSLAACSGGAPTGSAPTTTPSQAAEFTGLAAGTPTQKITTTENKNLSAKLPKDFGNTLNNAIDLSSPPSRFIDENGQPAGYEVDFAALLAQKLGLKSNVNNVPFPQIIPGLAAKRYDLSVNNYTRTPEREAQVDMVEYIQGSVGVAYRAGNPKKIDETKTSLCGLSLGVLSGSYQEQVDVPEVKKQCEKAGLQLPTSISYGTNNEAILALSSGRYDAWLGNGTVAAYAAAQHPEKFKSTAMKGTLSHSNISLPKNSPLTPIIAEALQELMDEGTYEQVLDKWGIKDWALDKASAVATPVIQK